MADKTVTPIDLHTLAAKLHGRRFGRLTAIQPVARSKGWKIVWLCLCDCGNEARVFAGNLTRGHTVSCGCAFLETITKHGSARDSGKTDEYRIWTAMKARCRNPGHARYGGRGISVCERWQTFENFLEDMGPRPPRMSIERKDNNGDYTPENCKWATQTEQARNTCQNVNLTFKGETLCVTEWAERTGLNRDMIQGRLRKGWSIERTLTEHSGAWLRNNPHTRFITLDGQTKSLAEWAELTGLGATTITFRLKSGWSTGKALTTPAQIHRRK